MALTKSIYEGGMGEIVEKKSRFIATICPVETEEEATAFIAAQKKKYYDARHNCSAYIIGRNGELKRSSDDGEPSGTAGRPILEVLEREGIYNVCVVVTRYFGGTLLGTGGLVRAYQGATKEAMAQCSFLERAQGHVVTVIIPYTLLGKFQYFCNSNGIPVLDTIYETDITLKMIFSKERKEEFVKEVMKFTEGSINCEVSEEVEYALKGQEILLF
ncbi:MAG: YigZ family protein [Lachnospiraceae bacterium]|nr:YigZ family protein [Lachnospiraceae bacterium]